MRIRPPVKWHGGKYYLARKIIESFPDHHTYVEPYGGVASVLLNKKPASVEVYNDLNGRLTNLFIVIRDHYEAFQRALTLTPYSESEFQASLASTDDPIEKARRDYVGWRQSLGGRGDGFSYTLHRVRRGMADVVSGWLSSIDEQLPMIMDRLRSVQIMNRPAVEIVRKWDHPDTLFYLDPPYLADTRAQGSQEVYDFEMTEEQHTELAEVIRGCKGKVVLSGYWSELYQGLYEGWRTQTFDIANHAAGGKTKARKQEMLWFNY